MFPRFRSCRSVQREECWPRIHLETMLKADNFCVPSYLEDLRTEQNRLTLWCFWIISVIIPTSWTVVNRWIFVCYETATVSAAINLSYVCMTLTCSFGRLVCGKAMPITYLGWEGFVLTQLDLYWNLIK